MARYSRSVVAYGMNYAVNISISIFAWRKLETLKLLLSYNQRLSFLSKSRVMSSSLDPSPYNYCEESFQTSYLRILQIFSGYNFDGGALWSKDGCICRCLLLSADPLWFKALQTTFAESTLICYNHTDMRWYLEYLDCNQWGEQFENWSKVLRKKLVAIYSWGMVLQD